MCVSYDCYIRVLLGYSQEQWYSAEYGSTGGFGQQSVDSVDVALGRGYSGDSGHYYGNSQPAGRRARGGIYIPVYTRILCSSAIQQCRQTKRPRLGQGVN